MYADLRYLPRETTKKLSEVEVGKNFISHFWIFFIFWLCILLLIWHFLEARKAPKGSAEGKFRLSTVYVDFYTCLFVYLNRKIYELIHCRTTIFKLRFDIEWLYYKFIYKKFLTPHVHNFFSNRPYFIFTPKVASFLII